MKGLPSEYVCLICGKSSTWFPDKETHDRYFVWDVEICSECYSGPSDNLTEHGLETILRRLRRLEMKE
jgi:hypothetical protein